MNNREIIECNLVHPSNVEETLHYLEFIVTNSNGKFSAAIISIE